MSGPTIADIVNHHFAEHPQAPPETLVDSLIAREQAMADVLRMAGVQFGMYPQIVAEVLAEVEMGEPVTQAQRTLIRAQFNELMEQIARAQRGEGPMPAP